MAIKTPLLEYVWNRYKKATSKKEAVVEFVCGRFEKVGNFNYYIKQGGKNRRKMQFLAHFLEKRLKRMLYCWPFGRK